MLSPKDLSPNGKAPSVWSLDSGYGTSMAEDESRLHSVRATASPAQPHKTAVGLGLQGLDDTHWLGMESVIEPMPTTTNSFANQSFDTDFDFLHHNTEIWKSRRTSSRSSSPKSKALLSRLDIPLPEHQLCSICQLVPLTDPFHSEICAHCSSDLSPHHIRRSRAGRNAKLPLQALNCLQNWLSANQHNPYPSAETKKALAQECGITEKQVTTWFTNARARQLSPLGASPASGTGDEEEDETDTSITPIETMEGLTFIAEGQPRSRFPQTSSIPDANIFSPIPARQRSSRRGKKKDYRRNHSQSDPPASIYARLPPAAMDSNEEFYPTQLGQQSAPQAFSTTSHSPRTDAPPSDPLSKSESWQCTFCRKHLVPKSWRRHEETQHRPKAQWTCMLRGPRLLFPGSQSGATSKCAFCMMEDPPEDHFQKHHRIDECAKRDQSDRTFYRPDHLRQHVKNFHGTGLFDIVQARWKSAAEAGAEGWNCGFCGDKLETWDKRETHIANHFKDGMKMDSWQDFSNTDDKSNKRGKGKRKERAQSQIVGMGRIGQPLGPNPEHNHYSLDTATPPQQAHSRQHHSQHHQQQQFYQGSFPQQAPLNESAHRPGVTSTYHSIPFSSSFSLTQPPQPVLPAPASLEPLMMDCTNPFEWGITTSTAAPLPIMQPQPTTQQPYPQMNYPLTSASSFQENLNSAAFQQQFDSSLQSMGVGGVDLYGNPIEYQGGHWEQ